MGSGHRQQQLGTGNHGKTRRGLAASMAVAAGLALVALTGSGTARASTVTADVSAGLLKRAIANPTGQFTVIIQSPDDVGSTALSTDVSSTLTDDATAATQVTADYSVIHGVSAVVSGSQLVDLASDPKVSTITEDARVQLTSTAGGFSNDQMWPDVSNAPRNWGSGDRTPAIAVVDSGVAAGRADFGGRVVKQVGFGHGILVGRQLRPRHLRGIDRRRRVGRVRRPGAAVADHLAGRARLRRQRAPQGRGRRG